jgi:hypothetical protein
MGEFQIGDTVRTKGGAARTTLFEVVGLPVPHERDKAGNITQERDGRLHVRYKDDPSHVCHVDPALYEVVAVAPETAAPETSSRSGRAARSEA